MVSTDSVRISKWVRERLERIKELEGHGTIDSVLRYLLYFRVMSIGYQVKTGANPSGMLFNRKEHPTKEKGFEGDYDAIEKEVYADLLGDSEGIEAFIDWIKEKDPQTVEKVLALRKEYKKGA